MKPLNPNEFQMDTYVDANFMGIYGKEERADPDDVKSHTGYVILLSNCPIIWASKLQESITLSTMMAEYYALSVCMREVLPLRDLIESVAEGSGLDKTCATTFKTTVWEDNMGALHLAKMQPRQHISRSKFYDNKVHWFRSHLRDGTGRITVEKIDTKDQVADLFTKPLAREPFERLRLKLMGW